MPSPEANTPRKWSPEEDGCLKKEVQAFVCNNVPINWSRVSSALTERSNKDCWKRWQKIDARWKSGAWTRTEDQKLRQAVARYGMSWAAASAFVGTRNPDQCAKRWRNTLDPSINHDEWRDHEDSQLLQAVRTLGRDWKAISERFFSDRSRLDLSNRHALLLRKARSQDTVEPPDTLNYPPQQSFNVDNSSSNVYPLTAENLHVAVEPYTSFDKTPSHWLTPTDTMESLSTEELNCINNTFMEPFDLLSNTILEQSDSLEHLDEMFNLQQKPQFETCNSPRRATPTVAQIPTNVAWSESEASTSTVSSDAVPSRVVRTVITIDNLDATTRAQIVDMVLEKRGQISITTG